MAGQLYARTVTLDLDTESWDEILLFGESVKEQISDFPGLLFWTFVADPESGRGTSFSVFESEAAFLTVNDEINQILSSLRNFLTAPPTEILGPVWVSVDNRL